MELKSDDLPIKTATMAKIFVQQGHYDEAIAIYRHLLQIEPDRRDLSKALTRALEKRDLGATEPPRDMAHVLSSYIRMLLNYRQLLDLKDLKRRIHAEK